MNEGKTLPEIRGDRRNQILDVTLLLVGKGGYRGLSYQDVADQCGLTKQGVMHYFPSKKRLLLALLHERDASIETALLELLEAGGFGQSQRPDDLRTAFRASLIGVIKHMLGDPAFMRLLVILRAEAINAEHPAHEYFVERDRGTLIWLTERCDGFSEHPGSTARQILAAMSGLQEQWLRENHAFDMLAEWKCALAMILPVGSQ